MKYAGSAMKLEASYCSLGLGKFLFTGYIRHMSKPNPKSPQGRKP